MKVMIGGLFLIIALHGAIAQEYYAPPTFLANSGKETLVEIPVESKGKEEVELLERPVYTKGKELLPPSKGKELYPPVSKGKEEVLVVEEKPAPEKILVPVKQEIEQEVTITKEQPQPQIIVVEENHRHRRHHRHECNGKC